MFASEFMGIFNPMKTDLLKKLMNSGGWRVLLHLLFWVVAFGFLSVFFGRITYDYSFSLRFAALLLPVAMGTTYFINYSLVPRYLLSRAYGRFVLYFVYTLIISMYFQMWVLAITYISIAEYNYEKLGPVAGDFIFQTIGLYSIVLMGVAVKLLKLWMKSERDKAELKTVSLEAALKLREAELQLLRGQIHPHFLFNTLNNLYGLALEKSDKVPDSIIRLSQMLDFLLYRSDQALVPLSDEIKLIGDYIELEKLRFDDRLRLEVNIEGDGGQHVLAPFLLFPFVENAFKHGFMQDDQQLYLAINLAVNGGRLHMKVANSYAHDSKSDGQLGGVGLSNVRRRLDLLYPGRHDLTIAGQGGLFTVTLALHLNAKDHDEHPS